MHALKPKINTENKIKKKNFLFINKYFKFFPCLLITDSCNFFFVNKFNNSLGDRDSACFVLFCIPKVGPGYWSLTCCAIVIDCHWPLCARLYMVHRTGLQKKVLLSISIE